MRNSEPNQIIQSIDRLRPKNKSPVSARVLTNWIAQAQDQLGMAGGRLGWLIATTVVSAVLQRVTDESSVPLFLLKGGTMLQYRLDGMSRATQDLDGLVRCDVDQFLVDLDKTLTEPWGPLSFSRSEAEVIQVPYRIVKPRRFDLSVMMNGIPWRRIQVEVSPDEGGAGSTPELIHPPSLSGFGLPSPDHLVGLAMSYQVAQKVHAVTGPHDPPVHINDRARDVVDLILVRDLSRSSGHPSLTEIREAVEDVFHARAVEAEVAGGTPREWPVRLDLHPSWESDFRAARDSAGLEIELHDAVKQVNEWLGQIEKANTVDSLKPSTAIDPANVSLSGQLVCKDESELKIVLGNLPLHIELTRGEPGCISFEVVQTNDPLVWQVEELFSDEEAFSTHQVRVTNSEWGRATTGIERRYNIS